MLGNAHAAATGLGRYFLAACRSMATWPARRSRVAAISPGSRVATSGRSWPGRRSRVAASGSLGIGVLLFFAWQFAFFPLFLINSFLLFVKKVCTFIFRSLFDGSAALGFPKKKPSPT